MKYNHAFTIAFEVVTDSSGDKVTESELLVSIANRLAQLIQEKNAIEACGLPYDTYENE